MKSWSWVGAALLLVGGVAVGGYVGMTLFDSVSEAVDGPPTLVSKELSWGTVSEETTSIQADLEINNPNRFGLQVQDVETTVQASGIRVGNVTSPGFELGANQSSPVNFTAELANQAVLDWWSIHTSQGEESTVKIGFGLAVGGGQVEKDLSFTVNQPVETDISDQIESEIEDGEIGCPNKESHPHPGNQEDGYHRGQHFPCVVDAENRWVNPSESRTVLVSDLTVYNPNQDHPVFIPDGKLRLLLHDIGVASGEAEEGIRVPAEETKILTVRAPTTDERLLEWWPQHVNGDCETSPGQVELVFDYEWGGQEREYSWRVPLKREVSTSIIC